MGTPRPIAGGGPPIRGGEGPPPTQLPPDSNAAPAMPAPAAPSITSPTPIGRQSNHTPALNLLDSAQVAIPQVPALPITGSEITGAIPAPTALPANGKLGLVQVPPTERLPEGIAG